MAQIFPFRAYRYSPSAGDPAHLLTQPYDKITPEMQERYLSLSPYNLARIIRPDSYTRAAQYLDDWIAQGILVQEPQPSLFAYFQKFQVPDTNHPAIRKGVITLAAVEDYSAGTVYRHELTHSGPKRDRLELLRHTHAHFGQLFLLYDDPQLAVDALLDRAAQTEPATQVTDEYGAEHTLWPLRDPQTIATIQRLMAPQRLLIADGHHRYETALAFRRENPHLPGADKVMMTLVNMRSPGLVILPTHRVVYGLPDLNPANLLEKAKQAFTVEPLPSLQALQDRLQAAPPGRAAIGALLPKPYIFETSTRQLDVVLLHETLLQGVAGESNIRYIRGFQEAARQIDSPEVQAVFLLNPVPVDQVANVAFSGGVMPQKSTDFYPKLLSGMAIYKLE
jgi:uncharacterized protein (DUF1015 family)